MLGQGVNYGKKAGCGGRIKVTLTLTGGSGAFGSFLVGMMGKRRGRSEVAGVVKVLQGYHCPR